MIKITLKVTLTAACLSVFGINMNAATVAGRHPSALHKKHRPVSEKDEMAIRNNLIEYAEQYLGIRYVHGGKMPDTGFDCSGFTSYCMGSYNVRISPSSSTQSTEGLKISLADVKPGDLIFFGGTRRARKGRHHRSRRGHHVRRASRGGVSHVAMVVENSEDGIIVIHATCHGGVMKTNINQDAYWRPKILFARDVITPRANSLTEPTFVNEEIMNPIISSDEQINEADPDQVPADNPMDMDDNDGEQPVEE